ncbi:MAG: helix-turn-helix domain-containing protein [Roseiflexaceae bacterium]
MTDTLLLLIDRVKNTIQLGESHFREFKSALEGPPEKKRPRSTRDICKDIGEALVAFSNADGGELLIGVEDDGHISGIEHKESDVELMLKAWKTHVHHESSLPIVNSTKIQVDGKLILFFSVSKGTTEIYQLPDGRCVRRKDKSTVPITVRQIMFDRQEVKSREYDRQFVDGATVSDLDVNFVQSVADNYLRGISVERYLQQSGLAEYAINGLKLRFAALLLFARDIQRWHPRSQVRILKVTGTELKSGESYNVRSEETVKGNVFELIINSWEQLRPYLAYKTEFGRDAKFEQKYTYPEWACREALINAIAHRDYTIQNGIDVFVFDDHMEIRSPGSLLSTISVKDLEQLSGAHESRNVLISKILRENKYMRELGEGMKRIFELMEQNELQKPTLYSNNTYFSVSLPNKSVFSEQQEQWLAMFEEFRLSSNQKKIVVLGMDDRSISPRDIYRSMNTSDRNTYDREVTGLRQSGILIEIRSNRDARSYAFLNKIAREEAPRFKVTIPATNNTGRCVFVNNISRATSSDSLRRIFERCGPIERVDVPIESATNRPRGFAFVWYISADDAKKAITELNGAVIDNRKIVVDEYRT